jgi:cytochrome c oxidase subunit 4
MMKISGTRGLILVWAMLLVLLALTVAGSFVFTGPSSLAVSLGIALAKSALVYWFFMNLRQENGLIRVVALGVAAWLLILFLLAGFDYLTRSLT